MGTFLTALQVYISDEQGADVRRQVIDSIRRHMLAHSFVETSQDNDQDPDQEVLVGPIGSQPWLTIFCPEGNARPLARELSRAVDGTVVLINLLDSDVLHLRRYTAGQIIDDYCNDPDAYEGISDDSAWLSDRGTRSRKQRRGLTRGDLAKWRDLMVETAEPDKLREAWNSNSVFADDILAATADSLGMSKDALWSDPPADTFARLTFRTTVPRQYEQRSEGLPKLILSSWTNPAQVFVGEPLNLLISVSNGGGPATGLDMVAWGSALETGVIKLEKAMPGIPGAPQNAQAVDFGRYPAHDNDKEVTIHVASFENMEIPAGTLGGPFAAAQPGIDFRKAFLAMFQTDLHFIVVASVATTGRGDLNISIAPRDNRHAGMAVYQASLEALPAPRRPLRAKEAQSPMAGRELHRLEKKDHLFALVALSLNQEQSAEVVADVMEGWVAQVAKKGTERMTIGLRKRLDLMPGKEKLLAQDVPGSRLWNDLRDSLKGCVSLEIKHRSGTVLFDASTLSFQHSNERPTPQLGIFFRAWKMGKAQLAARQEWLVEAMDRLMRQGIGLQAMVGRWDWGMSMLHLERTPYELVCGVGGQCTTARFWCAQFLRGVTERLWLGPELLTRLEGAEALAPISNLTQLSQALRIDLNENATLDDLEAALAPLLASEADWREGMDRLYPRK